MVKINEELLDRIGQLEVSALLDGLNDPDLRRNPAFLEKVRKFLAQNKLQVTEETPGVSELRRSTEDIPIFDNEVHIN